MKLKQCIRCKLIKQLSEFDITKTKGKYYRRGSCQNCDKEYQKNWVKNNVAYSRHLKTWSRLLKLNRIPIWVNKKEILEVYLGCPVNLIVDHIIPIKGKAVCGLHVPWNLQYLTPQENWAKNNRILIPV